MARNMGDTSNTRRNRRTTLTCSREERLRGAASSAAARSAARRLAFPVSSSPGSTSAEIASPSARSALLREVPSRSVSSVISCREEDRFCHFVPVARCLGVLRGIITKHAVRLVARGFQLLRELRDVLYIQHIAGFAPRDLAMPCLGEYPVPCLEKYGMFPCRQDFMPRKLNTEAPRCRKASWPWSPHLDAGAGDLPQRLAVAPGVFLSRPLRRRLLLVQPAVLLGRQEEIRHAHLYHAHIACWL